MQQRPYVLKRMSFKRYYGMEIQVLHHFLAHGEKFENLVAIKIIICHYMCFR